MSELLTSSNGYHIECSYARTEANRKAQANHPCLRQQWVMSQFSSTPTCSHPSLPPTEPSASGSESPSNPRAPRLRHPSDPSGIDLAIRHLFYLAASGLAAFFLDLGHFRAVRVDDDPSCTFLHDVCIQSNFRTILDILARLPGILLWRVALKADRSDAGGNIIRRHATDLPLHEWTTTTRQ